LKRTFLKVFYFLSLFIIGYVGLGLLIRFFKPEVHILPQFMEEMLGGDYWKEQSTQEQTFENLSYELLHSQGKASTPIVFTNDYNSELGIFCFRGNAQRNAPTRGSIAERPTTFEVDWEFETAEDNRVSKFGVWGGGSGWTGQPLIVQWPKEAKQKMYGIDPKFIKKKKGKEVILGSLCGDIYFLDFETGLPTRKHVSIHNPIKGTVSVDPRMNGLLYVGQGIPNGGRFGSYVFNMFSGSEVLFRNGLDSDAHRQWGAFDSNSLIDPKTGYWIHPAENGMIYKTKVEENQRIHQPEKFRYKVKGQKDFGIESSFGAWNNLGYFGDNAGNVFCLNLTTMKPVWILNNYDDTDASMVIDIQENGKPYLYLGNEVDKQGPTGKAYIRKIDAKTGKEMWRCSRTCAGSSVNGKINSGGVLASVLPGKKKAAHLVYGIYSRVNNSMKGELVALDKKTGKVRFSIPMDHYSWASPIDIYDKKGNCYLFFTDVFGYIYLIDGLTGEIIEKKKTDKVWESSPVAWNDRIILGARGNKIYSFLIK
jgi:outer membrane protein assembly factor BamB